MVENEMFGRSATQKAVKPCSNICQCKGGQHHIPGPKKYKGLFHENIQYEHALDSVVDGLAHLADLKIILITYIYNKSYIKIAPCHSWEYARLFPKSGIPMKQIAPQSEAKIVFRIEKASD